MNPALSSAIQAIQAVVGPIVLWRTPCVMELVPLNSAEPLRATLRGILREVATKHGIAVELLRGRAGSRNIARIRAEFYYRAAAETTQSLNAIGYAISREHAAVRHGIGQHCMAHDLVPPRGVDFVDESKRRAARCREWHRKQAEQEAK